MGKMVTMLTMLICIDIMFIILAPVANLNLSSILVSAIFNLGSLSFSSWVGNLFGNVLDFLSSDSGTLAAILGVGTSVVAGITFRSSDTILFIPMALVLGGLVSDYIAIAGYMAAFSPVLTVMIMAPITIMFIFVAIEWARGKD